jgi:hypothetical protein
MRQVIDASPMQVMNDIATLDANIQWAPWFTVDGQDVVTVSFVRPLVNVPFHLPAGDPQKDVFAYHC